jgi:hypothetical protein
MRSLSYHRRTRFATLVSLFVIVELSGMYSEIVREMRSCWCQVHCIDRRWEVLVYSSLLQ